MGPREKGRGGSADALELPMSLPGQSFVLSLLPEPSHLVSPRARGHLLQKLKGQVSESVKVDQKSEMY